MRRFGMKGALSICLVVFPGMGQSITPPFPVTLEKELADRAVKYTEVSLDGKMLEFAGRFLSEQKDEAEAKEIIQKLNGIYVREYDFDKPGEFSRTDLERIRAQFKGLEWSALVRERSKTGESDSDVYVKLSSGKMQGLFVLDAQPKELDLVYIAGDIDPARLSKLEGHFGIPDGITVHSTKQGGQ